MKPLSEDPGIDAGIAERLLAYLSENANLTDDQLADIQAILAGDDIADAGGLASDAALRQRQRDAFVRRFPHAARLSTRYG
jgi:hypothetical protein